MHSSLLMCGKNQVKLGYPRKPVMKFVKSRAEIDDGSKRKNNNYYHTTHIGPNNGLITVIYNIRKKPPVNTSKTTGK